MLTVQIPSRAQNKEVNAVDPFGKGGTICPSNSKHGAFLMQKKERRVGTVAALVCFSIGG